MIEVAVSRAEPWPESTDWNAVAARAVAAGLAQTPHGEWLNAAVAIEVSIRLTDNDEVKSLNLAYRQKDRPTNVLSFPMVQADLLDGLANTDDGEVLLGDIVLAYGVCADEASDRAVSLADHASHLIVHGLLHLIGYDHAGDAEAGAMESIERDALESLGIADPYPVCED